MELSDVRRALERGDFAGAFEAFAHVPEEDRSDEALELFAMAAYGAGRFEACLSSYEVLCRRQEADGRRAEAAATAALIAMHLLCDSGLMSPVRGWVARSRRLAEGLEPGPVDAMHALITTYQHFLSGDLAAARAAAPRAVELGAEFGVETALTMGTVATARLLIEDGEVEAGFALLDDVAVKLMSGGLDPFLTGNTYCELICAAQSVGMLDRAREWTEVMDRWRSAAFGAPRGRCRVHRAELLRISGPGEAAEEEALLACAELEPWMRRELGWPLVELGNIRLRRGDLAGAAEAYAAGHDHAWDAQPGLALLRLEEGDAATAAELIAEALAHPADLPWKERPPFGDLRLAPLWEAQAEIASVTGDAGAARSASEALAGLAARYESPCLAATAALAEARASLLEGDTTRAAQHAQRAVVAWVELDGPYDAATARMVLGAALDAAGNRHGAELEWRSAAAVFAAFGAPHREDAARRRLQPAASDPTPVRPASATASLVRRGDLWEACFRDVVVMLPDLKGLGYLHRLLSTPGTDVPAVELAGVTHEEDGLPVLDDEARAAYRRRLREVESDIDEAERDHDLARAELAGRDREYLLAELSGALGLGGRGRLTGGTAERARGAVTRSLRYAVDRLSEQHPDLGAHVSVRLRTGSWCSYLPDPVDPVTWRLD